MPFLTETRKLKSKTQIGDFTQPQQKYAGTGENCNIAIAHFLPWNKNFMKIFVHLIWVCKHSDI